MGKLKVEDIVLSIDRHNVENDGTIGFRDGERILFFYLLEMKHLNDTIHFEILREGKVENVRIELTEPMDSGSLVPNQQYDVAPAYYILGGLVFQPLTLNYLMKWGDEWEKEAPADLLYYHFLGERTKERQEIVLITKVLADEINIGYQDMEDLISAFQKHTGDYHVIIEETGGRIVLEKKKVDENSHRILKRYGIHSDRSENLFH